MSGGCSRYLAQGARQDEGLARVPVTLHQARQHLATWRHAKYMFVLREDGSACACAVAMRQVNKLITITAGRISM